jgi:hypothetical protein
MERQAHRLAAGPEPEQVKVPQPPPLVAEPEENTKPAALQPTPVHEPESATTAEPALQEPSVRHATEKVVKDEEQAPGAVSHRRQMGRN